MKYPMINRQPRREVNVPELSGGLNLRDSLTGVRDNQMTDCVNMWYKDGMLRTRPGFVCNEDISGLRILNSGYILIDKKVHHDIVNDGAVLISLKSKTIEETLRVFILFIWQKENEQIRHSGIYVDEDCDYFVLEKNGILYCYLSNYSIYTLDYRNGETKWSLVGDSDYYIPTVMVHCHRSGLCDYTGTQFEGYNLLTDRYKMIYSAYNESDTLSTHPMRYGFIKEIAAKGVIRATITYIDENEKPQICVHEADASGLADNDWVYEDKVNDDGLKMYVCKNYLGFSSEAVSGEMPAKTLNNEADKKKYGLVEDNLIIEVQAEEEMTKQLKKVFGMTQSIWFGGASKGINGGSRLFLCGNTDESEKALVMWSGLNEPLYFPENNYAYVGNKAHQVTAFAQQGENLIIFKPNEMYYSYYASNDSINAEDLINQTVIDYEASSVFFPVVTLHSSIGCDCPDTIQLCRNRLVWLNSKGKVFTLISANQYSEMTVYEVSDLIEKKIKEYDADTLKKATSQDFDGYYMLIINSEAYLMDYNSYGYTHIYSYSKTEDANLLIPWYYWKLFPKEFFSTERRTQYCSVGNGIIAIYDNKPKSIYKVYYSVLNSKNYTGIDEFVSYDTDNNEITETGQINSKLRTKLFDFSAAGYLKNVDRVSIGFGNNGGKPINVSFVTDKGCESDMVTIAGNSTDERDAAFVAVKNFYVSVRAVRTFGVKIECDGPLVVDGLSLQYRLLGGVK